MKLEKSFSLPTLLSVFLHGTLLVIFLGNWDFFKAKEEPYQPHYVTATLVDLKPKAKAAPQQTKEQVLDSKAYEDLKNNKKQEEQRHKEAEALVQSQLDQQAKAAEAEKQKQEKVKEEEAKVAKAKAAKAEAEKKKKAEEEANRKAEAAKKKLSVSRRLRRSVAVFRLPSKKKKSTLLIQTTRPMLKVTTSYYPSASHKTGAALHQRAQVWSRYLI